MAVLTSPDERRRDNKVSLHARNGRLCTESVYTEKDGCATRYERGGTGSLCEEGEGEAAC